MKSKLFFAHVPQAELMRLLLKVFAKIFENDENFNVHSNALSVVLSFLQQEQVQYKSSTNKIAFIYNMEMFVDCIDELMLFINKVFQAYTELINRIRQYEYTDCFGYYLAVALKIWINCFIWYGVYTRISKKSEFQMNTFISIKMYFKQYNKVIIVAFVCGVCYYVSSCVVMVVNECAFAKVAFAVNTLLNELSDVVLYGGLVVLTLETPMQYSSNSNNNNNNSNSEVGNSNRKYTKYHGDVFYEMQHACLNSLDKIE